MNISFIAVNYNNVQLTINYIKSIEAMKRDNITEINIIIVDNNSNLNDFNQLELYSKNLNFVKLIRTEINLGYFKGLNEGIKTIEKKMNQLIVIGNNDLTFDENFVKNLLNLKYTDKTLVIAPNIITLEGRQQNPHVLYKVPTLQKIKAEIYFTNYYLGQFSKLVNAALKKIYIKKTPQLTNNYGQIPIKRGIGACYVLTPQFFSYYDKLDDRVFLWGEEALLSNQVEIVGGITLYDPTIIITHHESASVKKIESKIKYKITKASYKIYKKYL